MRARGPADGRFTCRARFSVMQAPLADCRVTDRNRFTTINAHACSDERLFFLGRGPNARFRGLSASEAPLECWNAELGDCFSIDGLRISVHLISASYRVITPYRIRITAFHFSLFFLNLFVTSPCNCKSIAFITLNGCPADKFALLKLTSRRLPIKSL
jgi:hypothetical protein